MKEKDISFIFTLDLKFIIKFFLETLSKFLFILIVIVLKRSCEVVFELLSSKVIIPLLFFYFMRNLNFMTNDILNSILAITGSSGILIYKYFKDKGNAK
mgnify:CR=1 FL=1